jgi:hypothetical protein
MNRQYEHLIYLALALGLFFQVSVLILEINNIMSLAWMTSSGIITVYSILIGQLLDRNHREWLEWAESRIEFDYAESDRQDKIGRIAIAGFCINAGIGLTTILIEATKYFRSL